MAAALRYSVQRQSAVTISVGVPANLIGQVIGRDGQMIRRIIAASNTRITNPDRNHPISFFNIKGSRHGVETARAMMDEIVFRYLRPLPINDAVGPSQSAHVAMHRWEEFPNLVQSKIVAFLDFRQRIQAQRVSTAFRYLLLQPGIWKGLSRLSFHGDTRSVHTNFGSLGSLVWPLRLSAQASDYLTPGKKGKKGKRKAVSEEVARQQSFSFFARRLLEHLAQCWVSVRSVELHKLMVTGGGELETLGKALVDTEVELESLVLNQVGCKGDREEGFRRGFAVLVSRQPRLHTLALGPIGFHFDFQQLEIHIPVDLLLNGRLRPLVSSLRSLVVSVSEPEIGGLLENFGRNLDRLLVYSANYCADDPRMVDEELAEVRDDAQEAIDRFAPQLRLDEAAPVGCCVWLRDGVGTDCLRVSPLHSFSLVGNPQAFAVDDDDHNWEDVDDGDLLFDPYGLFDFGFHFHAAMLADHFFDFGFGDD